MAELTPLAAFRCSLKLCHSHSDNPNQLEAGNQQGSEATVDVVGRPRLCADCKLRAS
jgi:hypothetical protein